MMSEHPINDLMQTSMQKLREMVDVNTIVGQPIRTDDGTTIIPVSKVTFGFGSAGSDFPSAKPKDMFGGGSGGGVSISPIAFLVISNGNVRLLQLAGSDENGTTDRIINMVPDVVDKVSGLFQTKKSEQPQSKNTKSEEK